MENSSDARAVRRVRCPRCHCVLEEPSAPVYQCGGCGTSLRAKNRTGNGSAGDVARASPSRTGLPPQTSDVASTSRSSTPAPTPPHVGSTSRSGSGTPPTPPSPHVGTASSHHRVTTTTTDATDSRHGSGDLIVPVSAAGTRGASGGDVKASTSTTPPRDATARSRGPGDGASTTSSSTPDASADTASRGESGGPMPVPLVRNRVSEQVAMVEKRGRQQSARAGQEVHDESEISSARDARGGAESGGDGGARLSGGNRDASPESQDDTEEGMKRQAESTGCQELVPKSAEPEAAAQPAREDDDAGEKAPTTSPSRHEIQEEEEHLGPLRKRILKTVDELKGDLSELFSKSPELNGTRARRPPRLPIPIPKQEESHVSRAAAARETRHAAAAAAAATDGHRGQHGSAARAARKPRRQAAAAAPPPPPRGLPSRRYRQCRAYSSSCHHGHGSCCGHHHGKPVPECSSCRRYCCRPARAQEPAAGKEKEPSRRRRLAPRNHCRPVLKGAPFIVCSSCFKLVQVPADFAVSVSTRTSVRKLRCGSCSAVLSYSYRDPARKKKQASDYQDSMDRRSSSELLLDRDPFAPFIDAIGLSSYSTTEDEQQRLPVSRNTSFDTLDGARGVGRLHRLMGYGSASELLRHSPDLYESFSERTTPDVRQHDRKGKGVWIDDDDDYDVNDSDEEDIGGALKRSAGKGSAWPLAWMPGKGTLAAGAIRIK